MAKKIPQEVWNQVVDAMRDDDLAATKYGKAPSHYENQEIIKKFINKIPKCNTDEIFILIDNGSKKDRKKISELVPKMSEYALTEVTEFGVRDTPTKIYNLIDFTNPDNKKIFCEKLCELDWHDDWPAWLNNKISSTIVIFINSKSDISVDEHLKQRLVKHFGQKVIDESLQTFGNLR